MTVNSNTVVNNKLIDILQYCESIISDTENIEEFVNEEYLDNQEFFVIRQNVEDIQSIIVSYDIDNNESLSEDDILEIEEKRIQVYQYSKYILESYLEDKNDNIDNLDDNEKFVIKCFKDISESVSIISDLIESV
jgi:predicted protein tyrosine phosphatase